IWRSPWRTSLQDPRLSDVGGQDRRSQLGAEERGGCIRLKRVEKAHLEHERVHMPAVEPVLGTGLGAQVEVRLHADRADPLEPALVDLGIAQVSPWPPRSRSAGARS